MNFSNAIAPEEFQPDPRGRRRRMLAAPLRGQRFGELRITVRDISNGGLGGTTEQWLRMGEHVQTELPNLGEVGGTVVWTEGNRFGLSFDHEIDAARVMRPAMQPFHVMDRYRPEASAKRPAIGLR
jgi:hypothetical protein